MTELALPRSGQGWGHLLTTPKYNGGDHLPADLSEVLDDLIDLMPPGMVTGITQGGTPSVIYTFQAAGGGELMAHWANDGRTPLGVSMDVMDALMTEHPGQTFIGFCRRPALVRLLSGRGWTMRAKSGPDDPYMVLMQCHVPAAQPAE